MKAVQLQCEYLKNPVVDKQSLRLSWQVESSERGEDQTGWQVRIYKGKTGSQVWDSETVESGEVWCHTAELKLESCTVYRWTVVLHGDKGRQSEEAEAFFETAFLSCEDWKARWIEPEQNDVFHEPDIDMGEMFAILQRDGKIPFDYNNIYPCPMLRRDFTLPEQPEQVKVYCTAHGIYRLELNGERVSDDEFSPGYTPYDKLLAYQTYDVTSIIRQGENAIGVTLADGWYSGRIGGTGDNCQYGNRLGFLMQMELVYADGRKEYILSDENFRSTFGPLRYSDIFLGESYDARMELPGWSLPRFDDKEWTNVEEKDFPMDNLTVAYVPPVRVTRVLPAAEIVHTPKGETIVDFGQVIAGRVRMKVSGPAGTEIVLEHCEVLDEEGNFLNNISGRYKDQLDRFTLNGKSEEEYIPWFTFHGFRYVKVTGYPGEPAAADFQAEVITTDMEMTGAFSCSNGDLNQLQHNLVWSLMGNTLSVPTDCPQRERAGWTGDAQIIAPTAFYNMDIPAFFRHYLRMMRLEQKSDGQIPIVIPFIPSYAKAAVMPLAKDILPGNVTSAGWGDVCTILPWAMYRHYGDKEILRENYSMMRNWQEYIRSIAENYVPSDCGELSPERRERMKYLWNTNFHFGDWLAPSASIDPETGMVDVERSARLTNQYIPAVFYAVSTDILRQSADVLGYEEDAEKYSRLLEKIRTAFGEEYVDEEGRMPQALQGLYVTALQFGLIPGDRKQKAAENLVALVEANGNRLDTGFLATPYLLDVMQQIGRQDKALELLYQTECPSWLYEVKKGATTIWESWHGIHPDGRVGKDSYNHFAYGCVGDWMYRNLAGLKSAAPGYSRLAISPITDSGLSWAQSSCRTVYGEVSVHWNLEEGFLKVDIPANTTAEVRIPGMGITESGLAMEDMPGLLSRRSEDEKGTVVEIASGSYDFKFETAVQPERK